MADNATDPYHGTIPSNTLKIMGIDLTCIGDGIPQGAGYQELRRTDEAGRRYKKFVLKDGRLVGAILLGEQKGVAAISKLIAEGQDVSAHVDQLLGDNFDPKKLL
jgi:nitrite reductase (NADH) large subunit